MKKFEYYSVEVNSSLSTEGLNQRGEHGWELVSHTTSNYKSRKENHTYVFKRELQSDNTSRYDYTSFISDLFFKNKPPTPKKPLKSLDLTHGTMSPYFFTPDSVVKNVWVELQDTEYYALYKLEVGPLLPDLPNDLATSFPMWVRLEENMDKTFDQYCKLIAGDNIISCVKLFTGPIINF